MPTCENGELRVLKNTRSPAAQIAGRDATPQPCHFARRARQRHADDLLEYIADQAAAVEAALGAAAAVAGSRRRSAPAHRCARSSALCRTPAAGSSAVRAWLAASRTAPPVRRAAASAAASRPAPTTAARPSAVGDCSRLRQRSGAIDCILFANSAACHHTLRPRTQVNPRCGDRRAGAGDPSGRPAAAGRFRPGRDRPALLSSATRTP